MSYNQNLKNEKAPTKRVLLPVGMRHMTVVSVEYNKSKQGNPQFIFQFKDNELDAVVPFYAIDVEGKRGNLKMVLDACMVLPDQDGNYSWDNPDVLGKDIVCDIVHEPNEYINRKGETIRGTQHRIAEITTLDWEQ